MTTVLLVGWAALIFLSYKGTIIALEKSGNI